MTSVSTQEIHTSLLKSFHEKSVHRPNQSEGQSGDKRSFVLVETRSESMQVVLKRRVHNQEAENLFAKAAILSELSVQGTRRPTVTIKPEGKKSPRRSDFI